MLLLWLFRPAPEGYRCTCRPPGSASRGMSTSASHQTARSVPLHAQCSTRLLWRPSMRVMHALMTSEREHVLDVRHCSTKTSS